MSESPRIIRKRRRPAHSCVECRRRKVRCDRNKPCGQCVSHGAPSCNYADHVNAGQGFHVGPASTGNQNRSQSPTSVGQSSNNVSERGPTTFGQIHGIMSKTRIFGHGHWMNTMPLASELSIMGPTGDYKSIYTQPSSSGEQDPISQLMTECKQLAREAKKQRPFRQSIPAHIHQSIPKPEVIEDLISLYFSTFESCYRILHFSSFKKEYDSHARQPQNTKTSFLVVLLLVMSISGTLHNEAHVRKDISAKAQSWISVSQTWLSAPFEKDRLTLKGIQIHCLLLLARQVNRVGADLVWISVGTLMRMAMQMGLHQDPSSLREMDIQQKEVRRRLWYTILEMNAQSALDSGMAPMVTDDDYTTQPPSDLSDEDLDNATNLGEDGSPSLQESPTFFQCVLAQSVGFRLTVVRVVNSLNVKPSYDEVLSIGHKLEIACREAASALNSTTTLRRQAPLNQFAHSFCSHLIRRLLLCLHFTYAIQAKGSPIYTHSQQVCLEVSLELVSLLDDNLYSRLLINGGGMFRDIITRGALVIYLELTSRLPVESSISHFAKEKNQSRQIPLMEDAQRVVKYAENRMCHGETNVKGYVFFNMATARVQALLEGISPEEAIRKAARDSLNICHGLLSGMVVENAENPLPADFQSHSLDGIFSPQVASDSGFDFLEDPNLYLHCSDWDLFDSISGESLFES
ncbi:transcriptional regulator family: Fungal Specific TF [Penicillium cosmopolitanum]|uniref:Transcriptional regulator family: Fungal Specific TF n=1 Tax=Penicillium cosmopolitanum TaxID=1131564 RepID=A0A9W9W079_9EURO|nr:transcriptional regulator family: Fungal Specific TF [Penicillium cosmopolitanum]KAJ5392658.1 transcriptional regulator family: Fungal Specific TF [Penicillium cosmopolitanum]